MITEAALKDDLRSIEKFVEQCATTRISFDDAGKVVYKIAVLGVRQLELYEDPYDSSSFQKVESYCRVLVMRHVTSKQIVVGPRSMTKGQYEDFFARQVTRLLTELHEISQG